MSCVLGKLECAGPFSSDGNLVCDACANKHDENIEETRKRCWCSECHWFREDNGLNQKEKN